MSAQYSAYVPSVNDGLIPQWLSRLNGLGMTCEIHPGCSLLSHSGFLPFKVTLNRSTHECLVGNPFLSGFEFHMNDFSLARELAASAVKPTLFDRLLGKSAPKNYFESEEVDRVLSRCTKVIRFSWSSKDTLELRMATVSAAILAELTGGVSCYSAEGYWFTEADEVEKAVAEAEAYESSVSPERLVVHPFDHWL